MTNNLVQQAIDKNLSQVYVTQHDVVQIMNNITEGKKVKKKLSVVFVITILLILMIATAVAVTALQALYEKAIEKQAESGLVREWSTDEKVSFIDDMVDAGIELDADQVQTLQSETITESEKDTLAMQILTDYYPTVDSVLTAADVISKEYGRYGTWSLELQAWYSDTLEKNGGDSYPHNMIPDEDVISETEAISIAKTLLTEVYEYTQEEADAMLVERFFYEVDVDGTDELRWFIKFYPDEATNEFYYVTLKPNGDFIFEDTGTTIVELTDVDEIEALYYDLRIEGKLKTVEDFASFAQNEALVINEAIASGLEVNKWVSYFAAIPYSLPTDTDITQEEANQIADAAMMEHMGWTYDELYTYYLPSVSFRNYDGYPSEWRFGYYIPRGAGEDYEEAKALFNAGEIPFCVTVRIDSQTGEVFEISDSYEMGLNVFGE